MKRPTPRQGLLAGLALIVVTNAVTLGLVAWNRSGEPEAVLSLGERELDRPWDWRGRQRDNSGLTLSLRWRMAITEASDDSATEYETWNYGGIATWLDSAKLETLGFPPADPKRERLERRRMVLLVLEFAGDAYRRERERAQRHLAAEVALRDANPGRQEFVQRVERAEKRVEDATETASRLFAIDAGLDLAALRTQYPDRHRYAIVAARVRPAGYNPNRPEEQRGYVEAIEAAAINVPKDMRDAVPPDAGRHRGRLGDEAGDRFVAEIAFGQRLEPWLLGVTKTPAATPPTANDTSPGPSR